MKTILEMPAGEDYEIENDFKFEVDDHLEIKDQEYEIKDIFYHIDVETGDMFRTLYLGDL